MALNYETARMWAAVKFADAGDGPERSEWFHSDNGDRVLDMFDQLVEALVGGPLQRDEAADLVAESLSVVCSAMAGEYGD